MNSVGDPLALVGVLRLDRDEERRAEAVVLHHAPNAFEVRWQRRPRTRRAATRARKAHLRLRDAACGLRRRGGQLNLPELLAAGGCDLVVSGRGAVVGPQLCSWRSSAGAASWVERTTDDLSQDLRQSRELPWAMRSNVSPIRCRLLVSIRQRPSCPAAVHRFPDATPKRCRPIVAGTSTNENRVNAEKCVVSSRRWPRASRRHHRRPDQDPLRHA